MTSPNEGGRIALRPRARLVRALGDELISSETVAVTELVKNSYDADATDVLVRFTEPLERGRGCIELIDNGHGMSPETLSRLSWSRQRHIDGASGERRLTTAASSEKRESAASRSLAWRTSSLSAHASRDPMSKARCHSLGRISTTTSDSSMKSRFNGRSHHRSTLHM